MGKKMNLGVGANSTSVATSSASWKSGDTVSDQFPVGLRVLVVDDDHTCLRILERMLTNCRYDVTKCSRAEVALQLLRDNMDGFDVVISDVHMPDMDGFKLLEHIGLEMDVPVIMMSADDSKSVVMKGVTHGACDYLIKPVRMEALKNIWQHVIRKKKYKCKEKDKEHLGSVEEGDKHHKPTDDADHSTSANEGNWRSSRKREEDEDDGVDEDDSSSLKKQRVVWTVELHQLFVTAVNQLGIDKAVPKKILQLMNVQGLSRENVASHLQKYRLYLRRIGGQPQDAGFGMISSLNGLEPHALATIQPTAVPIVDQRNIYSFNNPNMRFVDGQQHYNHGIPTNMALHQSAQPFGQSNPVIRQQSRTQMLNQVGGNQLLSHQSIPGSVFSSRYGMDNVRAPTYMPLPQAPSVLVVQPGFSGDHRNGHTSINREPFSAATNGTNLRQQRTPLRIKAERQPETGFQQQEDRVGYDEYQLDNLS